MRNYVHQVLVALDQLLNALLNGWADETLSSRAYRAELNGTYWGRITRPLIDLIFFWQADHCAGAFRAEIRRKHFPADMRT